MSWWDDGAEVLGDTPADQLRESWRGRPGFAEALNAYAKALNARVIAYAGAEQLGAFDGQPADGELVSAFRLALDAIGESYQDRFERPPTAAELVKTLEFVLGGAPGDYLRDASAIDWSLLRLRTG